MNGKNVEYSSHLFYPYIIKLKNETSSWTPTPHAVCLAEGMLAIGQDFDGKSVLEIGTGTGIHAILGCKLGSCSMDVTEVKKTYLDEAIANTKLNECNFRKTMVKDWTHFIPDEAYDVLICNPPFCKAGTEDRRWFIKQLIKDAKKFLKPSGFFIFSQSSMADFKLTESELTHGGYSFRFLVEHRNLFRDYYFTEPGFMEESAGVSGGYEIIDGLYVETLRAYRAWPNP